MINIDTEKLGGLLDRLAVAVSRMDEAAGLLMQVTTHNEWGCPERHTINDYILRNRAEMQRIQADGHSYLGASRASAQSFVDAERDIGAMFATLDGLLAGILADPVTKVGGNFGAIAGGGFPGQTGSWAGILSDLAGASFSGGIPNAILADYPPNTPGIKGAFDGIRLVGLDKLDF